jgi:hypothetical protein
LAPLAHADTINVDFNTATFTGGASLQGSGNIVFAPNAAGTATFTLASVPGYLVDISVTGTNNANSFFNFLVSANGNPNDFVTLASDVNLGPGFQTTTLPRFIDLSTSDIFRIASGGTGGNVGGQISHVTMTLSVPGAIVGTGLPGLIAACAGLLALARRRRRKANLSMTSVGLGRAADEPPLSFSRIKG